MSETKGVHSDRSRMDRDIKLTEPSPYAENKETRWRSKWEIEEWAYDQGYDSGVDEIWKMLPSDIIADIGMLFIKEGKDHAREAYYEEVQKTINVVVDERLSDYVDGQLRLYAGYDVAENGDTLSEGDYSTWEDLRTMYEAGVRDKLCGDGRYDSI